MPIRKLQNPRRTVSIIGPTMVYKSELPKGYINISTNICIIRKHVLNFVKISENDCQLLSGKQKQ